MNKQQLIEWVKAYIADIVNVPYSSIKENMNFENFGLDSLTSVGMIGELSEVAGIELDVNIIYQFSTVRTLAEQVSQLIIENRHR
jgi:acyl carrier protein